MAAFWIGLQAPMMDAMGIGNFFTLVGLIMAVVGVVGGMVVTTKCRGWRLKRLARERAAEEERRQRQEAEKEKEKENDGSKADGGESDETVVKKEHDIGSNDKQRR